MNSTTQWTRISRELIPIYLVTFLFLIASAAATSWPASSSGTELSTNLGSEYEFSGAVWHPTRNVLFVVDDDEEISMISMDGSGATTWSFSGDLEGLAIADATSTYIYVLNEYPYGIYEFDYSSGTNTKSWSLSGIGIPDPADTSYGLEAVTFIPNGDHPYADSTSGGIFAVGSQETGIIYFVDIDLSTSGTTPTLLGSIQPGSAWIADMYYDVETDILYVLYDGVVSEVDVTTGTAGEEYSVLESDPEAITTATTCTSTTTSTTIYVGYDSLYSFVGYTGYPVSCSATSWPASSSGTTISSGLSSSFEPSGIVLNAEDDVFFVVDDNGNIAQMNRDGSAVTTWSLSGDIEGTTIADASTTYVYILEEYPFTLYEFDSSTGATTKSWDLSSIGITTPSSTSNGLEGVTFIPDGMHAYGTTASGGIFAVGSSDDGTIYFVDVPLSTDGGSSTLLGSVTPVAEAITDISFSQDSEMLYVLYASTTRTILRELSVDGTVMTAYTNVPGTDPEGIAFVPDCTTSTASVYIANDDGSVISYTDYPLACIDTDADGLFDTEETTYGTDSSDTDSDDDGLTDYDEIVTYGTDALVSDSDSGTISDGEEITNGTDPLDSSDDVVIDPNLISSYTINTRRGTVVVEYADGHRNTIDPFAGTDPIKVGLNFDSTVLIVTNGKRIRTFQDGVVMHHEYVGRRIPRALALTVTHGTSDDTIVVTHNVGRATRTVTFTLTGTELARV